MTLQAHTAELDLGFDTQPLSMTFFVHVQSGSDGVHVDGPRQLALEVRVDSSKWLAASQSMVDTAAGHSHTSPVPASERMREWWAKRTPEQLAMCGKRPPHGRVVCAGFGLSSTLMMSLMGIRRGLVGISS